MSTLSIIRPQALLRCQPPLVVRLASASHRSIHFSAVRRDPSPSRTNLDSTALQPAVKEKEEYIGSEGSIVGGSGRGAEGTHFQDQIPSNIQIKDSKAGWTLFKPIYTDAEINAVEVVCRKPVTFSDRFAHGFVKFLRGGFDIVSGYKPYHVPDSILNEKPVPVERLRKEGKILSDKQWLLRIIVLESFAGVPGMVGGTLRHLRSLRLLRRDGGWIHTLLEEAENERMHLLTFLTVSQPTLLTRFLVLGAQGVMYNLFFLLYLASPKTAHRFVGALEEEACRTYTHCISDIEKGLVPEWDNRPAPQIAIDYWRLPQSATLLDVIRAVRADEATHRFVNHSLANLDHKHDFNPFAIGEPSAETRGKSWGFTRAESKEFAKQSQEKLMSGDSGYH